MNLVNTDKIAICSDIHCGVHSDSTLWHGITKEWAQWFKSQLDSQGISTVFFLGDYFHNRTDVSVSTLQAAGDILSLWHDIKFIFVIGNHDCQNKNNTDVNSITILQGRENIHIIKSSETINVGEKTCTFVSWGHPIDHIDESDYLFGHFEISTFKMNNYKLCEKGLTTKELFKKSPIIFSGHFHHREERDYGKKKIIYVGNPFEMDFGDIKNEKGFYILKPQTGDINFISNPISPTHQKIKISEYNENIQVENKFIRLIVDEKRPVDEVDKIVSNLSKSSPLQLSVEYLYSNTPEISDIKECDLSGIDRGKAIEEFINLLDIDNKSTLNSLCQEIYLQVK